MPCQFFAFLLLALASQLESYLHLSIPFPLRSQRFRISRCYSILAIHFLHKAALCSSVSVSLHVRSNPYQINAFPYLLKSVPVNSPPSQFISHQSHSIHVSAVLLHCLAIQLFSLPCHCVSLRYFILLPSSLFLCSFAFLCYSAPILFIFLLLHFAAPWLISLPLHRLPHQFFFLPYQIFSSLGGSVSLLFYTLPLPYFLTIQGVLMPYLLSDF